jgi:hypothetical protein
MPDAGVCGLVLMLRSFRAAGSGSKRFPILLPPPKPIPPTYFGPTINIPSRSLFDVTNRATLPPASYQLCAHRTHVDLTVPTFHEIENYVVHSPGAGKR